MSSRSSAGHVLVAGAYGTGNLGDVVLLTSAVALIRECLPDAPLRVLSARRPFYERLLPGVPFIDGDAILPPRGNLLVYGGGTQFFAFENTDLATGQRLLSVLRSPTRIVTGLLRRALKRAGGFRQHAALGVGIGPFAPGSWREEHARQVFEKLGYVAVRDEASLEQCQRWRLSDARLRADLCFTSSNMTALRRTPLPAPRRKSLAAIVRTWGHSSGGSGYLEPLLATSDELSAEGWDVTFFSFCEPEDAPLNARLRAAGRAVVSWDPLLEDPAAFIARLAAHQVIVSARFHGALFAGLVGKPTITVELEPKLRIAARTLGTPELVWAQPFDGRELRLLISGLESAPDEVEHRVRDAVRRQTELANLMATEFSAFVLGLP